jgi:hypothetical protein
MKLFEADNFISIGLRAFYENVKFGCIFWLKTLQNNLHYFGCRLLARQ